MVKRATRGWTGRRLKGGLAGCAALFTVACSDKIPLGEVGGAACFREWVEAQSDASYTNDCTDTESATLPPFRAWIDDFASTHLSPLDPEALPPVWQYESDGTGKIQTRWGPASLDAWGTHTPAPGTEASRNGLRIGACSDQSQANAYAHAWGAKFKLEALRADNTYASKGFDFSDYQGIVFWIRRTGTPNTSGRFLIDFPTPDTVPSSMNGNGNCTEASDPAKIDPAAAIECYAHWSYRPDAPLPVNSTCWKAYAIDFAKLTPQFSPGPTGQIKKDNVLGIQFLFPVGGYDTALYWPFDFLIDDIYLY